MVSSKFGFSLVELMVVIVIISILLAVAVKGFVGQQPQRELIASIDSFANDLRWAHSQAAKTGNNIYLAFVYDYDPNQIIPPFDFNSLAPVAPGTEIWDSGIAVPPDNPGIKRTCKGYIVVEARPRYHQGPPPNRGAANISDFLFSEWGAIGVDGDQFAKPKGSPYTYRDYLGDLWMAQFVGGYKTPLEPIYPLNDELTNELLRGRGLARDDSNINRESVPEVFYPFVLYGNPSSSLTYQSASGYAGTGFQTALANIVDNPNSAYNFFTRQDIQGCKVFNQASRAEILLYNADYSSESVAAAGFGTIEAQTYDQGIDHPKMNDQIVDYVMIYKRTLPEHVFFMNPSTCKYQVRWNSNTGIEEWQDFQFLQFIIGISPQGRMMQHQWGFSPEYFPVPDPGNPQNPNPNDSELVHGNLQLRSGIPELRTVFLITDEVVEFTGPSAIVADNAAANREGNGRIYTYWPLSGKYYIESYTPNDRQFRIPVGDPRLDEADSQSGFGRYIPHYGYQRDYLNP